MLHSFWYHLMKNLHSCKTQGNCWKKNLKFAQRLGKRFVTNNSDLYFVVWDSQTSFSFPEAALLLVSTNNHDLWPCATPEVRDSRNSRHSAHAQSQVWQIWLVLVSIYCAHKAIQNRNVVGAGQGRDSWCWPKGARPLGTRMHKH